MSTPIADFDTATKISQGDLLQTLTERFGEDPMNWAFVCPACGDVATGRDFRAALADHPARRRDGTAVMASDRLGQECLGRTVGALSMAAEEWQRRVEAGTARGCDWTAYGLFRGPVFITVDGPDGTREIPSFRVAPAPSAPRGKSPVFA